jgi:hypothetical protein
MYATQVVDRESLGSAWCTDFGSCLPGNDELAFAVEFLNILIS